MADRAAPLAGRRQASVREQGSAADAVCVPESMPQWRADQEAVERLYSRLGTPIEERYQRMRERCAHLLQSVRVRSIPGTGAASPGAAAVNRQILAWLRTCKLFCRPPPAELIELCAWQLKVTGAPRAARKPGSLASRMRTLAADFVARNPHATPSQIRRHLGYDQSRLIKAWLDEPEFWLEVESNRAMLAARDSAPAE